MEDLHRLVPVNAEERFRAIYADAYPDVLRFVSRRVDLSHAEDVVAEVFLVVWRRFTEVPQGRSPARAWIFGVARGVMLNTRRGGRRRQALEVRLADPTIVSPLVGTMDIDVVSRRADLANAWPRLSAGDQEALALAYWDDLTSSEAATVLDISPVAFRLRLSRARRHLRRHLDLVEGATPSSLPISERSQS